jgi:hypothetical protein
MQQETNRKIRIVTFSFLHFNVLSTEGFGYRLIFSVGTIVALFTNLCGSLNNGGPL